MTQQLDLTFNTANTMDKMMTQSQSKSYSSSSYTNADQFDNYLSSANKSYTQENSRSFNDTKAQTKNEYKTNSQQDNKSNNVTENKTEYKETTKYEEKSNTTTADDKNSVKENVENNETNVSTDLVADDVVVENNEVDVNAMMLVSNAQMANLEPANNETVNNQIAMSDVVVDDEIPAEAIKSGINLDTLAKAVETGVEDTTGVNMQAVENAVKDTVSKEDTIAALYKVGADKVKEVKDVKDVKDVNVDTKVEVKIDETDLKDDTKIALNDDIKIVDKISDSAKDVKVELDAETKTDVKADLDVKNDVKNVDEKQIVADVKDDKKVENNNVAINLQDIKENVENKVNVINDNEIVDNKTQKIETNATTNADKMNDLKDEIQSAKLENAYETMSTQDEKSVKNDNKVVDDKFAKTNVQADETMDIKDDTKGIEFVSQKQDKVVDKNDVQDKHLANVKEKVENVKIQVEDNVKVNVNNQVQDSAKVEKANETMTKAGLSTQTLREMDGKVTAMETGNQAGAQFGETSQEMLMRDMLSQNATTQTTDAKTTVDFAQAMNKTTITQQTQTQQNIQEAQDVSILDQIRAKFAVSKQNGLQKITIGLTPESLGKVTVEIVKGQNGISAHLLADNPQAKEILDKNLDGLKSVLQSQGVNVNNVNVKVAEAGRSSDSNNNMFQNEDGQFNQGSNGEHSRGDSSSNQERRSEYEFMQNNAMQTDNSEVEETTNTVQMEKTVSIKGGNGKISYKL